VDSLSGLFPKDSGRVSQKGLRLKHEPGKKRKRGIRRQQQARKKVKRRRKDKAAKWTFSILVPRALEKKDKWGGNHHGVEASRG